MTHFILRNDELNSIYRQSLISNSNDENNDDFLENASKGRRATNIPFLIFHAICIVSLGILVIYCTATGDIDKIINGYDHCGNVCGKKNDFKLQELQFCTSMDMTDKPYLLINNNSLYTKECTKNCTNGVLILNRCVKDELSLRDVENSFLNYILYIRICAPVIAFITVFIVVLALLTLLVLRYFTAAFVWCTIIGAISLMAAVTGFCWHLVKFADGYIILAVVMLISTLVIIILVIYMRARIELVIMLFKESAKSLTSMPFLLITPIMTCLVLTILCTAWIYFTLWIESAATPVDIGGQVEFMPNGFIKFVRYYNIFVMLWMILFVYGCQNMLVAGAVARWYFSRDKKMLGNPILNSSVTMLKYHLGTISVASLIMAMLWIIRKLLDRFTRRDGRCSHIFCLCLCYDSSNVVKNSVGSVLNYFTLNVYVVTAIHGSSFCKSGSKAFELLVNNAKTVIAINSIGDFVLFLTKLLIAIIPVAIGYLILKDKNHVNTFVPLLFIAFVAIIVAQCFVTVFEMTITTIFVCFCEDSEINDGVLRPYYMSQHLMEFVLKSTDMFQVQDAI